MSVNYVNKKDPLHYRLYQVIREGVRILLLTTCTLLLIFTMVLLTGMFSLAGYLWKLMDTKRSAGNVTTKRPKKKTALERRTGNDS